MEPKELNPRLRALSLNLLCVKVAAGVRDPAEPGTCDRWPPPARRTFGSGWRAWARIRPARCTNHKDNVAQGFSSAVRRVVDTLPLYRFGLLRSMSRRYCKVLG